jgi:hypothetical protein
MTKFFKSIYGKIIVGLVILVLGGAVGYFVMPTKTETITKTEIKTETVVKYVSIADKTQIDKLGADITSLTSQITDLQIAKANLQKQIEDLAKVNTEAALKLKALRIIETKNWATTLESTITVFNADVTWYNNAIKVKQDLLVSPNKSIALLQASINAKQLMISALIADNPIGNLTAIRVLEDEIIALRAAIIPFETIITGLNADITAFNVSKTVVQTKITLDEKCIAEITRYINDGTTFSTEVATRLHVLGLI